MPQDVEQKDTVAQSASWFRYIAVWGAILLGTALAVYGVEGAGRLAHPFVPLTLSITSFSFIGLSTCCIWGLLFVIPMYFLGKAWLHGGCWWRLLLPIIWLQGIITSICLAFLDTGSTKGMSEEAAQAELARQSALAMERLSIGGRLSVAFLILLAVHFFLCGPKRSQEAIAGAWNQIRVSMKKMRETETTSEATKKMSR